MVLGVLILPPVRGASKQGGAPPNPVKGGKIAFGIGCGGQNNRPARRADGTLAIKKARIALQQRSGTHSYTNRGGDRTTTTAKGGQRPPLAESRSKRRHCRRQCRSLRRQGSEQGAAATSAEQRERIT